MAQTKSYTDLIALIEALFGASLAEEETPRVKQLVNMRAWEAYRKCQLWENFLTISEERVVDDSQAGHAIIPYTGAVYDKVSAAVPANAPYDPIDSVFVAHNRAAWDTKSATPFQTQGAGAGARLVNYNAVYGMEKTVTSALSASGVVTIDFQTPVDYYAGGTITLAGFATDTIDINGTHTLTSVNSNAYLVGNSQVQFAITDTASHTFALTGNETIKAPVAFVTYKKRLDGTTYGDGTGETADMPREFFNYIAHGVAADMLRADQNHAAAAVEDKRADQKLKGELARVDAQHAGETVFNRVRTHGTEATTTAGYY